MLKLKKRTQKKDGRFFKVQRKNTEREEINPTM